MLEEKLKSQGEGGSASRGFEQCIMLADGRTTRTEPLKLTCF